MSVLDDWRLSKVRGKVRAMDPKILKSRDFNDFFWKILEKEMRDTANVYNSGIKLLRFPGDEELYPSEKKKVNSKKKKEVEILYSAIMFGDR